MKRAIQYEAHDGERFATAEECRKHETKITLMRLVQMTTDQVKAAIVDRTDLELADAIEFAGNLIARKRRHEGNIRRKPKQEKRAFAVAAKAGARS